MNTKWIKWIKSAHKGLRYYEHSTRKHGKKKDRYYAIRFKVDKKDYSYGVGWVSDGIPEDVRQSDPDIGFEEYALSLMKKYKANAKSGSGPKSPKENRKITDEKKVHDRIEQEKRQQENITFNQYFEDTYFPISKTSKKKSSFLHEEIHFRLWLDPVIGALPIREISKFDVERIKKKMMDAKKAPRTIQYVLATLRQIWNMARSSGIVSSDSPTKSVKIGKFDNRRSRFLSHNEAHLLLQKLKEKDETIYQMSLLSLHTGLRASEIFHLTWGCINTGRGLITIMDAKSGKGRTAFMTNEVRTMFKDMCRGKNDDCVFMQKKGLPYTEIPTLFRDIVKELKFNDNISDSRQRVCFHTMRHSMASWHAAAGTNLYVIKELLGHGSITLTERYSHLTNGALQDATKKFNKTIKATRLKMVTDIEAQA